MLEHNAVLDLSNADRRSRKAVAEDSSPLLITSAGADIAQFDARWAVRQVNVQGFGA
jgi:hypothetical protein